MPMQSGSKHHHDDPLYFQDEPTTDPHDKLFKELMGDRRVAMDFFEQYLPVRILDKVDLFTLQTCKENFLDKRLNLHIVDCLFRVKLRKKDTYLYLHVEHQSSINKRMAFRLLQYYVNITAQHLKDFPDAELPIIFPMVFYHGLKPHYAPLDMFRLYGENADLVREILFGPYQLIDVGMIPDEDLLPQYWAGGMQLIFKYVDRPDFLERFQGDIMRLLTWLEQHSGVEIVRSLLNYVIKQANITDVDAFITYIVNGLSAEGGKTMPTVAEYYQNMGRVEGRVEGQQLAVNGFVKTLMENGFDDHAIAKFTQLAMADIRVLRQSFLPERQTN